MADNKKAPQAVATLTPMYSKRNLETNTIWFHYEVKCKDEEALERHIALQAERDYDCVRDGKVVFSTKIMADADAEIRISEEGYVNVYNNTSNELKAEFSQLMESDDAFDHAIAQGKLATFNSNQEAIKQQFADLKTKYLKNRNSESTEDVVEEVAAEKTETKAAGKKAKADKEPF